MMDIPREDKCCLNGNTTNDIDLKIVDHLNRLDKDCAMFRQFSRKSESENRRECV
jgi:hypothetical protein